MELKELRVTAGLTQREVSERSGVPQPNISAYEAGRRTPSPEVRSRLENAIKGRLAGRVSRHRSRIHALAAQHHARDPQVFGSVARGEDGPGSDLDILVSFTDDASLLDEVGLRLDLEDLLQSRVDLVGADSLRGAVRDRVLREAVPI